MASRRFLILYGDGCEIARGTTPRHALGNAGVPGGTRRVLAVIAEELIQQPESCGPHIAIIGNLVTPEAKG
jgi:hypothetical protein